MSTRTKVINYVMTAPLDEVAKTLDDARGLLTARKKMSAKSTTQTGTMPKPLGKPVKAKPVGLPDSNEPTLDVSGL